MQDTTARHSTEVVLIMPFENASNVPGIDWIGESFPEVIGNRLESESLFIISRDDRLYALDRLGIPVTAKPTRATVFQIAKQLDADYVIVGRYAFDGNTFSVTAQVMDMGKVHLSPEMKQSGPLTALITVQTSLAWDTLQSLNMAAIVSRNQFQAKFPPIRLDAMENYIRGIVAQNPQEKIKRFKEAVRLEPNHTLAMLQLGKTYYKAREYEGAMTWFAKIPPNDRSANEASFFMGLAAYYANSLEKSENAFRFLVARLPLTEVYNNLGVVAARRAEKTARGYFEKIVQTDPNDPDYHFNLALAMLHDSDPADAIKQLRESLAIRQDPEVKSLLDALSANTPPAKPPSERIKDHYDESAFHQLAAEIENTNEQRLQKMEPEKHAAFHTEHGRQLMAEGLAGEAEKQFREAVILDPTNAAAHVGLAEVLESSQDTAAARNEARVSLRLKPSAEAYLVLARLDLAERNPAMADQEVEKALALEPANAAALNLKREIAAAAGKTQLRP